MVNTMARRTDGGAQLNDSVLREVLAAHTVIRGPLVLHGTGLQVYGSEGQLVDPAQHILVSVHSFHIFR